MLVLVNTNERPTMHALLRLVLKFVYDHRNMGYSEVARMKSGMVNWSAWVSQEKQKLIDKFGIEADTYTTIGKKGTFLDEVEFQLQGMAWLLKQDESGQLEARKRMFREHQIDYKKFYKLPEAYKPDDFKRARLALEKNMKENPEDYE